MAEQTKPYEFRKLKADDLFLILNFVKKIGLGKITEVLQGNIDKFTSDTDETEVGIAVIDIAQVVIESLSDCKAEIYALLEATSNLSIEQIKDLDITTFIAMVKDFVTQKEFTDLFTQAVQLFNTAK